MLLGWKHQEVLLGLWNDSPEWFLGVWSVIARLVEKVPISLQLFYYRFLFWKRDISTIKKNVQFWSAFFNFANPNKIFCYQETKIEPSGPQTQSSVRLKWPRVFSWRTAAMKVNCPRRTGLSHMSKTGVTGILFRLNRKCTFHCLWILVYVRNCWLIVADVET